MWLLEVVVVVVVARWLWLVVLLDVGVAWSWLWRCRGGLAWIGGLVHDGTVVIVAEEHVALGPPIAIPPFSGAVIDSAAEDHGGVGPVADRPVPDRPPNPGITGVKDEQVAARSTASDVGSSSWSTVARTATPATTVPVAG